MDEVTGNNSDTGLTRGQSWPSRLNNLPAPRTWNPSYVSLPTLRYEDDNIHHSRLTYGPVHNDMDPGFLLRPIPPDLNAEDARHFYLPRPPTIFPSATPSFAGPQFDVNIYQQKKTLAQGMMDLALISSNVNQLRYLLQVWDHPYHAAAMTMIIASLLLQIIVGIGLIWNSRYDVKEDTHIDKANKTNNWTVIGIFLVTILNLFIACFGMNASYPAGFPQTKNAPEESTDLPENPETLMT